jgi:hypothetical protein
VSLRRILGGRVLPGERTPGGAHVTTTEVPEAKWRAVSFAAVGALLHEVLPVDHGLRPETIRRHVLETAEQLEAKLGPEEFAYDSQWSSVLGCTDDGGFADDRMSGYAPLLLVRKGRM